LPEWQGRISPVLDVAGHLILVELDEGREVRRGSVRLTERGLFGRVRELAALAPDVLICGAVSWRLESELSGTGMQIIPHACGPVEEVLAAFRTGRLTEEAFLMPGCRGRGRRMRSRFGRGRGRRRQRSDYE